MEDKKWFEKWFDSPYYPLLYKKRNHKEANQFIGRLITKLAIDKSANALDLACGEGRHSLELSKYGLTVTGIDLSERSINIAKELTNQNLVFSIEDMRSFQLDQKFDYIFNLFTSFGYFESEADNLQVLEKINEHLKKDGTLIIDFLNSKKVIDTLVPYELKEIDGVDFEIKKEITSSHVVKKIHINDGENDLDFFEKVQLFSFTEFEKMLNSKGLRITDIYGDYELNKFNETNSDRLIIFAKKSE